jgi:DNA-binding response OmpR family regulator
MDDQEKKALGKKNILVVEDDPFLVKAYQLKFAQEGAEVTSITDGKKAMDYIKANKPSDIVLLDIMLPGMSGFDILKDLRAIQEWKDVPVIILTNLGQSQDMDKAKELGAQEYIVKANTRIADIIERVKGFLK